VRDDESGSVELANDVRDRKSLTRASDPEERLVTVASLDRLEEFGDRLRLIAARTVVGFKLVGHSPQYAPCPEMAQYYPGNAVRVLL
jgi:hypothetical protein